MSLYKCDECGDIFISSKDTTEIEIEAFKKIHERRCLGHNYDRRRRSKNRRESNRSSMGECPKSS